MPSCGAVACLSVCLQLLLLLLLLPAVEQVKCEIFVSLRLNWIFHKSAAKRKDSFHLRFTIIQTDWKQPATHTHAHTANEFLKCWNATRYFHPPAYNVDIYIHVQAPDSDSPPDIFDTLLMTLFLCFASASPAFSRTFSMHFHNSPTRYTFYLWFPFCIALTFVYWLLWPRCIGKESAEEAWHEVTIYKYHLFPVN